MSITTGNTPAEGANPKVDHPAHYNLHPSGVECIEIVRHMGFNLGNAVKYIWRDGIKDTEVPLQDLEKAGVVCQQRDRASSRGACKERNAFLRTVCGQSFVALLWIRACLTEK